MPNKKRKPWKQTIFEDDAVPTKRRGRPPSRAKIRPVRLYLKPKLTYGRHGLTIHEIAIVDVDEYAKVE